MASLFLDIEAQVALSSDEEEQDFDGDDGFIDDTRTPSDGIRVDMPSSSVPVQHSDDVVPFLDDLERRYTGPSVSYRPQSSSRAGSYQPSDDTVLGKRKASEVLESLHPALAIAARMPSPSPSFSSSSTSKVTLRPIHPLTKQRLPVREEPTRIPEHRQVFETDVNTIAMFGPWHNTPPSSGRPEKGKIPQSSLVGEKRREIARWGRWAHRESQNCVRTEYAAGEWVSIRRGAYKGDVGQIWKAHIRQKTEDEVVSEQRLIEKALNEGKTPPESSPEFVFEGYWVLVVPRLPPPHLTQLASLKLKPDIVKAQKRFEAMIFNPQQYDIIVPEKYIKTMQGFEINGHLLSHGLLIKLFKRNAVDPASTVTPDIVRAFENHPHCRKFPFPIPDQWRFLKGEEVDVDGSADGECGCGRVRLSQQGRRCEIDYGAGGVHATSIHLIWKVINVGDYIRVVSGEEAGKEGLVVERHGKIIAVSERGSRKGILLRVDYLQDFFVHINSVTQSRCTFDNSAIPWLDKEVTIVKGPHCEQHGIVKDVVVRKPQRSTVSLWLFLPQPQKTVEVDVTKVAAKGEKEAFFQPNAAFVGAGVKFEQRASRFVSLSCFHSTEMYTMLEPGEEDLENQIAPNSVNKSQRSNGLLESILGPEPPPRSSPPAPTQSVPHGQTQAQYEAAGRHPLARPELVGISIKVDILHGQHKKAAVYVELARTPTGTIHGILRKGKGNCAHEIPPTSLAICNKRVEPSKDDPLLVVISGPHLGTFGRRITHFYVDEKQTGDDKWLVLAVVDKEKPVDKLTGVLIECGVDELAFVEESPTDRFRATHGTMKRVRDEARLQKNPEVRQPDTGNLDRFITIIHSQLSLDSSGQSM
ncbi:hypothetical protein V5O48_012167 [Marasmius crinis-equi]|uniref:KOW domain-containing protein n=1 Tax=Marasmius crinis-equi TaxID=585013 RepID=A0ABR3F414_9AGAR